MTRSGLNFLPMYTVFLKYFKQASLLNKQALAVCQDISDPKANHFRRYTFLSIYTKVIILNFLLECGYFVVIVIIFVLDYSLLSAALNLLGSSEPFGEVTFASYIQWKIYLTAFPYALHKFISAQDSLLNFILNISQKHVKRYLGFTKILFGLWEDLYFGIYVALPL